MSKKPTQPKANAPSRRARGKTVRPMLGAGDNPRLGAWLREAQPAKTAKSAKSQGKAQRFPGFRMAGVMAWLQMAWQRRRLLRPGRRLTLCALVLLVLVGGGIVGEQMGYDVGVSGAVRAFRLAVGLEQREEETFTGCLKGAAEGAFSSAVPVAEIVAAGELMLASPPLVIMGAGLGCSLGAVKSVALEGVGWAVHTGSDLWGVLIGRW